MKRFSLLLIFTLLLGSSCPSQQPQPAPEPEPEPLVTINDLPGQPELFYPVTRYEERLDDIAFGSPTEARPAAWHTGDDLEIAEDELEEEIPVYAMADGRVVYRNWLSGYGGILILQHEREGQILQSLYGHLDLGQTVPRLNESVRAGTLISFLGDDRSVETDRQRKHLHFALYPGSALKLNASVASRTELDNWIDPLQYLKNQQAAEPGASMILPEDWQTLELSSLSDLYPVSLKIPADWNTHYQPENESLAFTDPASGEVMLFVRYFDASEFLTLSTVTIHERSLRRINGHEAVDYDIEKKPWVADFTQQPEWRNQRHLVTDIRAQEGPSRFFVFAQNPDLDRKTAFYILQSFALTETESEE